MRSFVLGIRSNPWHGSQPTSASARPPTRTPMRVLLAVDGSSPSMEAARYIAGFPLPAEVDIRVVVSVTPWTEEYAAIRGADFLELLAGGGRPPRPVARP